MQTLVAPLRTSRLELIPCTLGMARAAIDAPARLHGDLGVAIPERWPSADLQDALPIYARQLERDPGSLGWGLWLAVDGFVGSLVGDVGFKGRPDASGRVEIGYGIAPAFRRRGYATEGATALVEWAFRDPNVTRIDAECFDDNSASIRVLETLGMTIVDRSMRMMKWELKRPF